MDMRIDPAFPASQGPIRMRGEVRKEQLMFLPDNDGDDEQDNYTNTGEYAQVLKSEKRELK